MAQTKLMQDLTIYRCFNMSNIAKLNQAKALIDEVIAELSEAPTPTPTPTWTSIPLSPLANEAGYVESPYLVELDNGELLCMYRKGASHLSSSDAVYTRKSIDRGLTWSSPQVFHQISGKAVRNHTLAKTPNGRLIAFSRSGAVSGNSMTTENIWKYISDDNGQTWTITPFTQSNNFISFGVMINTANGLMQTFYNTNYIFALFSTDNGETWGNQTTIWNTPMSSAHLSEPQAIAIDGNRIVVIMRDNLHHGRIWFSKSSNGGTTWTTPANALFSSQVSGEAAPSALILRGDDVYFLFTTRVFKYIARTIKNKESFWTNPAIAWQAGTTGVTVIYNAKSGTATGAEFGYPNMLSMTEGVLCAWYDSKTGNGTTETEILMRSI